MKVPLLDLKAQYRVIQGEVMAAMEAVCNEQAFILGPHVAQFEDALAKHNQRFHAEGPYTALVYYVVTGPRSGQMLWLMGPGTFTSLDGRPSGDPHDSDWSGEHRAPGVP